MWAAQGISRPSSHSESLIVTLPGHREGALTFKATVGRNRTWLRAVQATWKGDQHAAHPETGLPS